MDPSYLAIEIGGTKLQLSIGSASGQLADRHRFQVDPGSGGDGIRRQLELSIPGLMSVHRPVAIGVGFGGPVNGDTGRIACSHQIEGWTDFPLAEWLRRLTGLPTIVENDANTAALGEATRGAGAGSDPVFYITLGSGVGGGLVCQGRIYHGASPGEAEIGHVRLDRSGATVESRCSGWAVDRRIRAAAPSHPGSFLARNLPPQPGGEARWLAPALAEADPLAIRILRETAEDLAFGLSHGVHLFHPGIVVLGGGLALLGEPLRAAVADALPAHVMRAFQPGPEVALAALGEDAVPVGALLLAHNHHDRSP